MIPYCLSQISLANLMLWFCYTPTPVALCFIWRLNRSFTLWFRDRRVRGDGVGVSFGLSGCWLFHLNFKWRTVMIFSGSLHLFSDFLFTVSPSHRPCLSWIEYHLLYIYVFVTVLGRVIWPVLKFSAERALIVEREGDGEMGGQKDEVFICLANYQDFEPTPFHIFSRLSFFWPTLVLSAPPFFGPALLNDANCKDGSTETPTRVLARNPKRNWQEFNCTVNCVAHPSSWHV